MATYTNNPNECVFLNDKNIVCSLTGDSTTGYNPIPSHTLLSSVHYDLSAEISSVRRDAGLSAGVLSNALSDYAQTSGDNIFAGTNAFKGGTSIVSNDLSIVAGNYIQCYGDNVYNFSGANSFLQQECSDKYKERYGIGCTGAMGYCILSVIGDSKVKLSGDLSKLQELYLSKPSTLYSISLASGSESYKYTIKSITQELTAGLVEVNEKITVSKPAATATEADYIAQWNGDDNAFYSPLNPDVGNARVPSFYGNHAEGAATKAIQRCTHTEGRGTIADIRYSHAEGSEAKAFGMGSHAEGNLTLAYASYSHAEGNSTSAYGSYSHAEGKSATTSAEYSHVEGCNTSASGAESHAEGLKTASSGVAAHAEGENCKAIGKASHAEGFESLAIGDYSHAEGDGYCYAGTRAFQITASNAGLSTLTLDAISCEQGSLTADTFKDKWVTIFERAGTDGNISATFKTKFCGVVDGTTQVSVSYVPSFKNYANAKLFFTDYPLYGTVSIGSGAHTHGYQCHAMEDSTAFGCNNYALGRYSFAIGNANKADYMGVAIGSGNGAFGKHSIAMGGTGSADASTLGTNTQVYASQAFGWSGSDLYEVPASRVGTFNINPKNGISGFYIGNDNLSNIISGQNYQLSSNLLNQLSGATVVTEISSNLSTLSNELCMTSSEIKTDSQTAKDLATDSASLVNQISTALHTIHVKVMEDPELKYGLSADCHLSAFTHAVILMFSALSSIVEK